MRKSNKKTTKNSFKKTQKNPKYEEAKQKNREKPVDKTLINLTCSVCAVKYQPSIVLCLYKPSRLRLCIVVNMFIKNKFMPRL